jgi:hypothetical protein
LRDGSFFPGLLEPRKRRILLRQLEAYAKQASQEAALRVPAVTINLLQKHDFRAPSIRLHLGVQPLV